MKLWNPKLGNSRRTALGPTYGGEIVKLKLLNASDDAKDKYLVYSTNKKVIGLIKLPMDGNPNKTMGLIAHPDDVTDICCSISLLQPTALLVTVIVYVVIRDNLLNKFD